MNNTPSGLDSDFITKIKKTVNVLGGIEDTVQSNFLCKISNEAIS